MAPRWALVLTLLLGLVGGPGIPGAAAQDTEPTLRELAERVLQTSDGSQAATTALLPGAVPEDLPFQFTIPPGGRLLGSSVSASTSGQAVSIYVDVPTDPAALADLIDAQLTAQGWRSVPGSPFAPPMPFGTVPTGGFQRTPEPAAPGVPTRYCFGEAGTTLLWWARPREAAVQAVTISLTIKGPGDSGFTSCDTMGSGPRIPAPASPPSPPAGPATFVSVLPALRAPAGAELRTGGLVGGGIGRYASESYARTDLNASQLEAAFAQQLADHEWRRRAGAAESGFAWSTWTVPGDDAQQGLLWIDQLAAGRYRLVLRVDRPLSEAERARFALTLGGALAAPAPPITLSLPAATDESLLGELVERVLAGGSSPLRASEPASPPRLEVGRVPPEFPVALTVPSGARLLGAAVRDGGPMTTVSVYLDARGPADEIDASLRRQLGAQGWRPVRTFSPYIVQEDGNRSSTYCNAERTNLTLRLRTQPSGEHQVVVSATLPVPEPPVSPPTGYTPVVGSCGDAVGGRFGVSPQYPGVSIPVLTAPPGAQVDAAGGGGTGFGGEVVVVTPRTSAELAGHFATQLREAGWTSTAGATLDSLAWMTWAIPDAADWHALLIVYDLPGVQRHAVVLRVEPRDFEQSQTAIRAFLSCAKNVHCLTLPGGAPFQALAPRWGVCQNPSRDQHVSELTRTGEVRCAARPRV